MHHSSATTMHLALITGEFHPLQGGVGDYTRELAREFARRGLTVTVITDTRATGSEQLSVSSEQSSPLHNPPLTIHYPQSITRKAKAPLRNPPFAIRYTPFASWHSLPHVVNLIRDCDIIHIQYQAAAYGMTPPIHLLPRYLRWRNVRGKRFVTFHDLKVPYLFPKAGPLRWRAVTYLAQSCDGVIVTNQEDFQTLTQIPNPKSQLPITLIPIGSNIDAHTITSIDREAVRATLGVKAAEVLLCYFGFLNASKGGETLVRVLAKVRSAGYNARLLMVGGEVGASDPTNIAYAQRVQALVRELGVGDSVIGAGYRPPDEVTALWRASDIALLPYVDGASLRRGTLMAAIAHAMPIVSTTSRVTVSQLRNGENVLLAPPDDVDALAAQVIRLSVSPTLREQLSRGTAQLADEFSWSRIADQHLEFYRAVNSP
jgi:glycosyltransferase involved in cell wall biosynthesis